MLIICIFIIENEKNTPWIKWEKETTFFPTFQRQPYREDE